jgi:hypothetical protein
MLSPPVAQYPAASSAIAPPAASAPPHLPSVAVPSVAAPPTVAPATAPAARPMTAAVNRPTGMPAPAGIDVDALRGRIMRDLMRQLRDEFERGG